MKDLDEMLTTLLNEMLTENFEKHIQQEQNMKKETHDELYKGYGTMEVKLTIKEIISNEPYTILLYTDDKGNDKYTISKCIEGDIFSKEKGAELCALKAIKDMTQNKIDKF